MGEKTAKTGGKTVNAGTKMGTEQIKIGVIYDGFRPTWWLVASG